MSADRLRIEVAYALPGRQWLLELEVPTGTTVAEAIVLSGIQDRVPGLVVDGQRLGVFSRLRPPEHVLEEGDRVEIYRPLEADPREARRQRVAEERAGSGKR